MPAGFVDLDVRYRDAVTLAGVAVESVRGRVKNARGDFVGTITPEPEMDGEGVGYYARGYDVRNASKFAGLFITVDWEAVYRGISLPVFTKRYDYAPVAREAAFITVMQWPACSDPNVLFYEITRRRSDVVGPVFVGRSFGPFFIDKTVFDNEFDARSWKYWIAQYSRTPGFLQPDGSDYTLSGGPFEPTRLWRTSQSVCVVSGHLADIAGGPAVQMYEHHKHPEVIFTVHPRQTQQLVGSMYLMPEDVIAHVGADGYFSVVLLQDTIVEFRVTSTYFRGEFIVPRKDSVDLGEVDIRIVRDY